MDFTDILGSKQIVPDLRATDRWEAIDELIGILVATGKIKEADRIVITESVKQRERSLTTGVGFGVGMPTAGTDLIDTLVVALGRSKKGIDFAANDQKPVNVVLLHLVPKGNYQKSFRLLAKFAKLLYFTKFRKALEIASNADDIHAAIIENWKLVCGPTDDKTDYIWSSL
ncbi:MAG: PTS sugar transporter subunit IIA [Negativicutes bacterium]|nr:PTS sugar transporter subunit IIA [Negativicutes bacterium]